jgi:hypothetical protein
VTNALAIANGLPRIYFIFPLITHLKFKIIGFVEYTGLVGIVRQVFLVYISYLLISVFTKKAIDNVLCFMKLVHERF